MKDKLIAAAATLGPRTVTVTTVDNRVGGMLAFSLANVTFEHDRLGRLGDARQPQPGRHLARVHRSPVRQERILGVVDDQSAEVLGIEQHVAHHARVGHARLAVGEGDGAGPLEQADLGHLLALEPLGQRRHRLHMHDAGVARAPLHEIDHGRIVDGRRGVGLADDGGDAAGGGGLACGADGFAMFGAGLAHEGAHVDQPGGDNLAATVDVLGALGHASSTDAALGLADHAVSDQ